MSLSSIANFKRPLWTEADDALLRKGFSAGMSDKEIARLLGRTYSAVQSRRSELGGMPRQCSRGERRFIGLKKKRDAAAQWSDDLEVGKWYHFNVGQRRDAKNYLASRVLRFDGKVPGWRGSHLWLFTRYGGTVESFTFSQLADYDKPTEVE